MATGAVLLEPIMKLEVVTPDDYLGDIMADLPARRAQVDRMSERAGLKVIDARAPLEKTSGYSTAVRGLSQGRASSSMEPLEYAAAPGELLEGLAGADGTSGDEGAPDPPPGGPQPKRGRTGKPSVIRNGRPSRSRTSASTGRPSAW